MTVFIKGLFVDLYNRLEKMISHLDNLTMETAAASDYKKKAVVEIHKLKARISSLVDSGILEDHFFTPNTIILYNSLNNEFIEVELFLYLPISRYDRNAEGYFETVIQEIYKEIKSLQSVPFISTISNSESYYWAYSKYQMIALPQGEEKYLLNLSDLYHEIGHLIFVQHVDFLIGTHLRDLMANYEREKEKLGRRKRIAFNKSISAAILRWEDTWAEELACDLIATFLVGPAYAWSNMKLCAISSGTDEIYSFNKVFKEHPPDEVRMRAILTMLRLTSCAAEAEEIGNIWDQFVSMTKNSKPENYDLIFPMSLVESIAQNVFEGCKNITLEPYQEQLINNTRPVSLIINEAWRKIRNDPEHFNQWEKEQIDNLRSLSFFGSH